MYNASQWYVRFFMTCMAVVFALSAVFAGGPKCGTEYPAGIAFVREMGHIPEIDGWEKCTAGAFAEDSQKVAKKWDSIAVWVGKQYSAKTIRALSRWAQKQMADYKRTPALKGLKLTPVRVKPDHRKLVLEGCVGLLPVHTPTVTRRLLIYVLYDQGADEIVTVTVTIRGEVAE